VVVGVWTLAVVGSGARIAIAAAAGHEVRLDSGPLVEVSLDADFTPIDQVRDEDRAADCDGAGVN